MNNPPDRRSIANHFCLVLFHCTVADMLIIRITVLAETWEYDTIMNAMMRRTRGGKPGPPDAANDDEGTKNKA